MQNAAYEEFSMRPFLLACVLLVNACETAKTSAPESEGAEGIDCDNPQAPSSAVTGAEGDLETELCLDPAARKIIERPASAAGALPELSAEERAAVEKEALRLRNDIRRSRKARGFEEPL